VARRGEGTGSVPGVARTAALDTAGTRRSPIVAPTVSPVPKPVPQSTARTARPPRSGTVVCGSLICGKSPVSRPLRSSPSRTRPCR
jgi:hypothetical protein